MTTKSGLLNMAWKTKFTNHQNSIAMASFAQTRRTKGLYVGETLGSQFAETNLFPVFELF